MISVILDVPEQTVYDKPWAVTGTRMARPHNIANSLYLQPEELERTNMERFARYAVVEENEVRYEAYRMDDAEICVVAFGIAARVSKNAVDAARQKGVRVGLIRPITLWPFPKKPLLAAAEHVHTFLSVELSMGQMREDVELAIRCKRPVQLVNRTGGMIPSPEQVLSAIEHAAGGEPQ